MNKSKNLDFEVANFVCKFSDKNLLDCFEDRIFPIFSDEMLQKRGEIYKYQFLDVKLGKIDGVSCCYGRFVQRMKIKARQRLRNNDEIISTEDSLLSDPTSVFVLRLMDHKLFLIREIPRSPRLPTFERVFKELLYRDWNKRISDGLETYKKENSKKKLNKEDREKVKTEILQTYPEPSFHLTSISDPDSVTTLVDAFEMIQSVVVTSHVTNNEDYDLDEDMLDKHRKMLDKMSAESGNVTYKNTKTGLKKTEVSDLVKAAASTGGNATFTIKGKSIEGSALIKTEHDSRIRLTIPRDESNETISSLGKKAFLKLSAIVKQKLIKLAEASGQDGEKKAESVIEKIRRGNVRE